MKTVVLKVNPRSPEKSRILRAANIIKSGGLVAFPTETVYGLGANALNPKAVRKIFSVKGRPSDNPLIAHIAGRKDVHKLASIVPASAVKLMNKFWPGPLTLVLKKKPLVPKEVTAGLDTVAVRMPANKIARALIKASGVPIVAPSGNLSGMPSPTTARHVIQDLNGKIPCIIDGGSARIGVESTVIDVTTTTPTVLRPGGITVEMLRKALGKSVSRFKGSVKHAKSPGMKYRHYAPRAKLVLVEGNSRKIRQSIAKLANDYARKRKKVGIMTTDNSHSYNANVVTYVGCSAEAVARNLFNALRDFDAAKVDVILAEGLEESGLGLAVMNRLRKAASKIVKV